MKNLQGHDKKLGSEKLTWTFGSVELKTRLKANKT